MSKKSNVPNANGPMENLERAHKLAHAFSDTHLKPLCIELSKRVTNWDCIRIGEDKTNFSYDGFQLGESVTDFVQFLVEFNSADLTLRVLACHDSTRIFSSERAHSIPSSDPSKAGSFEWNAESAAKWMTATGNAAVEAFLKADAGRDS